MPRRAIIIGINYTGTAAELQGCVNDVEAVKNMLTSFFEFKEADIITMVDTDTGARKPTGRNIKSAISQMVHQSKDGDELFIHFSGHGTQIPTDDDTELDGLDEAICPVDMNIIADNDLRLLLRPLKDKANVKLTFIADCCHSGTLLDHEEVVITGPKNGGPPPPAIDIQAIQNMLASLGGGLQKRSRSLPYDDLCAALSGLTGNGTRVARDNMHATLVSLFGEDASVVSIVSAGLRMLKQHVDTHLPGAVQFVKGNLEGGAKNVAVAQETIKKEGLQQFVLGNLGGGIKNVQNFAGMLASHVQQHGPAAMQAAQTNMGNAMQGAAHAMQGFLKQLAEAQKPQGAGANGANGGAESAEEAEAVEAAEAVAALAASPSFTEPLAVDVGVLLTGCQDKETSADARPRGGPAYGAFTNAMVSVVKQHHATNPGYPLTYRNLVIGVRDLLGKTGFAQSPCLECSAKWADTPFIVNA